MKSGYCTFPIFIFADEIDYLLCQALIDAVSEAQESLGCPEEELIVAVSGDLTQDGTHEQFALAYTFLKKRLAFGWNAMLDELGLAKSEPRLQTVAGNHDHWGGGGYARSQPFNPGVYPSRFRPVPWKESFSSRSGRLELDLYGLDSNSGAWPLPNYLAGGSYSAEHLNTLEDMLVEQMTCPLLHPDGFRVRALVSHHALLSLSVLDRAGAWPLDGASRERILDIAARYEIAVIMTGHTHRFVDLPAERPLPFERTIIDIPTVIWELRSATSLKGTPQSAKQGFWLHRIASNHIGATWSSWRFRWNRWRDRRYSFESVLPDFNRSIRHRVSRASSS